MIDRVSIEPSRYCTKGCSFCYNGSNQSAEGGFTAQEVIEFAADCSKHGVQFLSIGGGEPLEWPGLIDTLTNLRGVIRRSFTTNGLHLDARLSELAAAQPDKVHISIHAPENLDEVRRVVRQISALRERELDAGVNLLVRSSRLSEARAAAEMLWKAGIQNDRIVYLPSRGTSETPTPKQIADVAQTPFQSMSCLRGCAKSERFVSIGADRTAAFCSYTVARRALPSLTYHALTRALAGLGLTPCDQVMVRSLTSRARAAR